MRKRSGELETRLPRHPAAITGLRELQKASIVTVLNKGKSSVIYGVADEVEGNRQLYFSLIEMILVFAYSSCGPQGRSSEEEMLLIANSVEYARRKGRR